MIIIIDEIDLDSMNGKDPIPEDHESVEVSKLYIPRPAFKAEPITENKVTKDILNRDH